jgi:hypothetical protein
MLALADSGRQARLRAYKAALAEKVEAAARRLDAATSG